METTPEYKTSQPNRLLAIASDLGKLYTGMRMVEVALAHHKEDLEGRKIYLAPADGWPGKNEAERKLAAERVYASDDVCSQLAKMLRENEGQLAELQAQHMALLEERRALEWMIRAQMVDALTGNHIDQNGNHGPVEETAFDDAIDAAMVNAAAEGLAEPEPEEEFPFPF